MIAMIYEATPFQKASALFDGWEETLIWSCLQGIMGKLYVDHTITPTAGMILLGDFCFFAGIPNEELVRYKPTSCTQQFIIMVPQTAQWAVLIEQVYGKRATRVLRYATKKEKNSFDRQQLEQVISKIPSGFLLHKIDETLFHKCQKIAWCRDWVSQYRDYEQYQKYGLGIVLLSENEPVSGASSYSSYLEGIEIEIDTKKEYRKRGFAYICGAKLILECIEKGLYPSWDAQNKWSLALAQKLGYHFAYEYIAYEIDRY